jgi:putative phosphoesterase
VRICIVSDSHDNIPLLCAAVADAKQRGVEAILHCGDIVAPRIFRQLQPYGLPIHAIHGNNTGDIYLLAKLSHAKNNLIHYYGQEAIFILEGQRIFLAHYPHRAQAMAVTGDYELVCYGHTHLASIECLTNVKGSQTVKCNPGSVGGVGAPATYIVGDLETMTFETLAVSNR